MKKVLIITDVDFWLKGAGHRMRISALLAHLATHTDLTVVYLGVVHPAYLDGINAQNFKFKIL